MVYLTRKMEFSASHRLWCAEWDAERNREAFGPSASPISHGHNYALEVTLTGEVDDETGMVMDLKDLKDVMEAEIGERFDHRDLNDDTGLFVDQVPTAENVAQTAFGLLDRVLPPRTLHAVRLDPTPDLSVEVTR